MAKHLCCSAFGKIYYANVNNKGIITGQKIDLTDDAVVAVMDKLSWLAVAKKPFDGKAEIDMYPQYWTPSIGRIFSGVQKTGYISN